MQDQPLSTPSITPAQIKALVVTLSAWAGTMFGLDISDRTKAVATVVLTAAYSVAAILADAWIRGRRASIVAAGKAESVNLAYTRGMQEGTASAATTIAAQSMAVATAAPSGYRFTAKAHDSVPPPASGTASTIPDDA